MNEQLERIAEVLESWAEWQLDPLEPDVGICSNLGMELQVPYLGAEKLVTSAAKSWPEFSGDVHYPVPHEHVSPESAYGAGFDVPKWGDDAYGQARRRLCQHIADWVRANSEDVAEPLP